MIYNITDDAFIYAGVLHGKVPVKLRQYDNRLWAVCDDGSILFSNNGDASTWDAANSILLPNWEKALDFIPVQGGVVITHPTGAYALYGSGTYQDTSILPIQCGAAINNPILTDSAVAVANLVYVLGNRGVYAISLNGIQEIPHNQERWFSANYSVWDSISGAIQGVYLYRFHSILYLFQGSYARQGLLFNIRTGGFFKINESLPPDLPYMVELNHKSIDFLIASDSSTICRSMYPPGIMTVNRASSYQTPHMDFASLRDKVFGEIKVFTTGPVHNVTITAYLDRSSTGVIVWNTPDMTSGENIISLEAFKLRGKTISFRFDIKAIKGILKDELTGEYLISETDGTYMIDETGPTDSAAFTINEMSIRYYETGPEI